MRDHNLKARFSRVHATALAGRRVRSTEAYAYLPAGTVGAIVALEEVEPDVYDLVVEWEARGRALRDWFSRDEYERFLVED